MRQQIFWKLISNLFPACERSCELFADVNPTHTHRNHTIHAQTHMQIPHTTHHTHTPPHPGIHTCRQKPHHTNTNTHAHRYNTSRTYTTHPHTYQKPHNTHRDTHAHKNHTTHTNTHPQAHIHHATLIHHTHFTFKRNTATVEAWDRMKRCAEGVAMNSEGNTEAAHGNPRG